jgi:predicted transposase YbfD/YdcC
MMMEELLKYLRHVKDERQEWKVKHKVYDIIMLVFLAKLSNANEWTEFEVFGKIHEPFLKKYLELPNGIPSHDTIQRVFGMISNHYLEVFQQKFHEVINSAEGSKIKRILGLDGKAQRGNKNINQEKENHIVSAVDDRGFCLGQELVDDKSNEITAVPELLDKINVRGHVITTDALNCQTAIAKKIKDKKADYVLALKGNQGTLHEDVVAYFADSIFLEQADYHKTVEKARSSIETREYWQTDDISWMNNKKDWRGLKSIAMTKNTIVKDNKTTTEVRYFISSLPLDVKEVARAIRGHWMVESYHWHLDVTFKEDDNHTIDKQAAFNLNIISKMALNTLKLYDTGKKMSLKLKRFAIGSNPAKYLTELLAL